MVIKCQEHLRSCRWHSREENQASSCSHHSPTLVSVIVNSEWTWITNAVAASVSAAGGSRAAVLIAVLHFRSVMHSCGYMRLYFVTYAAESSQNQRVALLQAGQGVGNSESCEE